MMMTMKKAIMECESPWRTEVLSQMTVVLEEGGHSPSIHLKEDGRGEGVVTPGQMRSYEIQPSGDQEPESLDMRTWLRVLKAQLQTTQLF
jgi:hypothetical protein